jgi:hypothetical protein
VHRAAGDAAGEDVDHHPWTRFGATLSKHGDTFYLFGGRIVKDGKKTGDLFVLSTDAMEWQWQETGGDAKPPARSDHCAVVDPEMDRLIIFGGRSQVRSQASCRPGAQLTC